MKLSNRAYDIGKYVTTIALPAVATFYGVVGGLWGFPKILEVVGTITATDTLLGTLLMLSAAAYNRSEDKYDGQIQPIYADAITPEEVLHLDDVDQAQEEKDILLKVKKKPVEDEREILEGE